MYCLFQALDYLLDHIFNDTQEQDQIGIEIRHPGLDRPILIPFRPRNLLDAETILKFIEEIVQSNTTFSLDDDMIWQVTKIGIPAGSAPKRKMTSNFSDWLKGKDSGHGGSVLRIENNDELCLARSLMTAKCHAERDKSEQCKFEQ